MDGLNFTELFTKPTKGDGTYYTQQYPGKGNCGLNAPVPKNIDGLLTVAMNKQQYADSKTCGMCLELTGHGIGQGRKPINGTRLAMVDNQCPECPYGDVDLGETGGGRWEVEWIAVECPTHGENLVYKFKGGSVWFQKLQIRNHPYPIESVAFFQEGRERQLTRTKDNHFKTSGVDVVKPIPEPIHLVITDVFGHRVEDVIEKYEINVEIPGNVQFPLGLTFNQIDEVDEIDEIDENSETSSSSC